MARDVPEATVRKTDFACPTCGAHASQQWFNVYGDYMSGDQVTPLLPDVTAMRARKFSDHESEEQARWENTLIPWAEQLAAGRPFVKKSSNYKSLTAHFENVFVSRCFNCEELAIWVHDRLLYPASKSGAAASPDLPQ